MDQSKSSTNPTNPTEQPKKAATGSQPTTQPTTQPAVASVADPKSRTQLGERWRLLSTRVRETSSKLGSEVRAAGEDAVARARERTRAWSLQRERAARLARIGERVFDARRELENLPASVRSECDGIAAIDEELRQLDEDAEPARPGAPGA